MPDFSEPLGLERETVRTIALGYVGYAVALQHHAREGEARLHERIEPSQRAEGRQQRVELEELRMVAASGLAIGASLYSVMYPRIARVLFRAAARAYDELKLEYAAILGLCGRDKDVVERQWERQLESPGVDDDGVSVPARLLVAMAQAVVDLRARGAAARVLERIAPLRGLPIGSAGISASIYRQWAADLLREVEGEGLANRSTALPRLFESFEERLEAVRANDVQWRHLDASLLPVEPEILAGALAIVRASHRRQLPWERMMGRPLSAVARIPLEIAQEMEADEPLIREEREILDKSEAVSALWQRFSEAH
jgi:hypothetical protein